MYLLSCDQCGNPARSAGLSPNDRLFIDVHIEEVIPDEVPIWG
jgi:hypothetical protein